MNKLVYVHCLGGHGRSGVIASCFLIMNNKISSKEETISHINRSKEETISHINRSKEETISPINRSKEETISPINRSKEAMKINNLKHLTRKYKPEIASPQTAKQRAQVIRFGKKVDLLMN